VSFTAEATAPWPLTPDWSNPVAETLAWLTDVLVPSRSAATQHRALRAVPRRELSWRAIAAGQERRLVDLLLAERGATLWHVPVWPDVQQLASGVAAAAVVVPCTTEGFDFVDGGLALLQRSLREWEVLEIDTVGATQLNLATPLASAWAAGTRLLPLRMGRIAGSAEQEMLVDVLGTRDAVQAQITEPCDWPAAMPTAATYRDWPVLEWRPDETEPPRSSDPRTLGIVDNETAAPSVQDMLDRALRAQRARWLLHGREEQTAWRSMLYALAGRANPVWVPSWSADLQLSAAVSAVATTITVQWCGYTLFGLDKPGSRDIRIELGDGTAFHRRITAAVEGADTETLTINAALGQEVQPGQVRQIQYLRLCTLASDQVQIEHLTDADGTARCALAFAETAEVAA
jgi:hypothetical protein